MVTKIVLPAAGLGSRLLPITKEIPKEMLPIFLKTSTNSLTIKPLIQILFEQFYNHNFREFCFVVGKQKRTIEDHFTPDSIFLSNPFLDDDVRKDLENFYEMLNKSKIFWVNQQEPKGFGDAVLYTEPFIGKDDFIVCAGDTLLPKEGNLIQKLNEKKLVGEFDACLVLQNVQNPKRFGIAVIDQTSDDVIVTNVEEKPEKPKTNLSIIAIYHFRPSIFSAIRQVKKNKNEIQLTDAIQKLIEWGGKVNAIILDEQIEVIDIGTVESYLKFLKVYDL